jgi:hypothetical protein
MVQPDSTPCVGSHRTTEIAQLGADERAEAIMRISVTLSLIGAALLASPATAHDTETAFPTRGACESASAAMSNAENPTVLANFPGLFDTTGEVASFLTRAFTCDRDASDGQYYITDHLSEVLDSHWFQQRNH